MKKISMILLFVLTGIVGNTASGYMVYGAGAASCGKWVKSRNGQNWQDYGQWVLGYVTSYGYYASGEIGALKETDHDATFIFMDNYCQSNPLEKIESGAQALIEALTTT